MIGLILAVLIFSFGIFLKTTKDPGFAKNKKYAWFFIIIGGLSFIVKFLNTYIK